MSELNQAKSRNAPRVPERLMGEISPETNATLRTAIQRYAEAVPMPHYVPGGRLAQIHDYPATVSTLITTGPNYDSLTISTEDTRGSEDKLFLNIDIFPQGEDPETALASFVHPGLYKDHPDDEEGSIQRPVGRRLTEIEALSLISDLEFAQMTEPTHSLVAPAE